MVIIETSIFTRQVQALLADEEYRELQTALVNRPQLGGINHSWEWRLAEDALGVAWQGQTRWGARDLLLGCDPGAASHAVHVSQE